MFKATFNIKTKEFTVKGKGIDTLNTTVTDGWEDYWDCVTDKKTGEPIYDVNLFFDDYSGDGGKVDNPKNYKAQYVALSFSEGGELEVKPNADYISLPLEVSTGEFEPIGATFYIKSLDGKVLTKSKRHTSLCDYLVINKLDRTNCHFEGIDKFGIVKKFY